MSGRRLEQWESLQHDGKFDVVVVGGGINGIGVYRELALQGARVLIVERNDFCSGCSAAPSRMIHGGLRYLENGELGLVRESLKERDALLANAPHLVHPLPTVIPIKSIFSGLMNSAAGFLGLEGKPSSRGALPIKIGLSLYDWITRKQRRLPRHVFYFRKETKARWPKLMPGLKCSASYYDAWISHPERLGIELLRDVAREAPNCVALNYAEVVPENNGFIVTCKKTGKKETIEARIVVNATGAWLNETIAQLQEKPAEQVLVSGTKGSHLIIDNSELETALSGHMVYFENSDGRVCVAFPYLGKVLAGSTDIRVAEARKVRCEPEEEKYILESLRLVFPEIKVLSKEVVFSFSGIRPLLNSNQGFTGRISRDHNLKRLDGKIPHFCMIGGKWTTFRAFAEQTAKEVLKELGLIRGVDTASIPIGGGKQFPDDTTVFIEQLAAKFSTNVNRVSRMVNSYGSTTEEILEYCETVLNDEPLSGNCDITTGEITYLLHNEFVETVSDIVLRRTTLAIRGDLSLEIIDRLIELYLREFNSMAKSADELRTDLLEELRDFYGVTQETLKKRNSE